MAHSERQWISTIKSLSLKGLKGLRKSTRIGIGDDCAVVSIAPSQELLVTTDLTLEDVHFRRNWHPAAIVGHRCLARGLSDIAAMGGTPISAFLSLATPRGSDKWICSFLGGLIRLARMHRVELAGGDLAQSHSVISADIVVLGLAPTRRALLRSGARPGDGIFVTGALGGAAATLLTLQKRKRIRIDGNDPHFYPSPRVAVGRVLLEKRIATSAIDVSDGLSTDLSHLCEESGVGAKLDASAIPISGTAHKIGNSLDLALHGGEDYELLFTASKRTRVPRIIAGVPITRIGEITRVSQKDRSAPMILMQEGRRRVLRAEGWEHFR